MTQKDKQLLLKDLSARLPYGVKFTFTNGDVRVAKGVDLIVTDKGDWEYAVTAKGIEPIEIKYIKPYLRPMSSMTEEESTTYEYSFLYSNDLRIYAEEYIDWLNANHFDYRGLIEKGLALEAHEGMYKI